MRRVVDLYPGQAKTDRDAFIIVDTARTVPHTLRRVDTDDDTLAELDVLVGFDDDLAGEATRTANRDLRGLLTGIHPRAREGDLPRSGYPQGLRRAGCRNLTMIAKKHPPRMGQRLVDDIISALDAPQVTVPGTAAERVLPKLSESLNETPQQRKSIAATSRRCSMLTSFPRPDLDARYRRQNSRPYPARSR